MHLGKGTGSRGEGNDMVVYDDGWRLSKPASDFNEPPSPLSQHPITKTALRDGPQSIKKEFNFEDLPCPPPDVASSPGKPYQPMVAPFPQLWDLDPRFRDCIVGPNQGLDPFNALSKADGPTLSKDLFAPLQDQQHTDEKNFPSNENGDDGHEQDNHLHPFI
ncbi:MAG: hypothetical protein Q9218_005099 [Villophora microphyllina]